MHSHRALITVTRLERIPAIAELTCASASGFRKSGAFVLPAGFIAVDCAAPLAYVAAF